MARRSGITLVPEEKYAGPKEEEVFIYLSQLYFRLCFITLLLICFLLSFRNLWLIIWRINLVLHSNEIKRMLLNFLKGKLKHFILKTILQCQAMNKEEVVEMKATLESNEEDELVCTIKKWASRISWCQSQRRKRESTTWFSPCQ